MEYHLMIGRIRRTGRALIMFMATGMIVFTADPAFADAATDRVEQIRYAKETVALRNDQFATRKANFLAAGCGQLVTCTKPNPYQRFDWTSDSCSPPTPPSWGRLFDPACQLHDFGYRNFGKGLTLGRDENTRRWIDDRFVAEMKGICNYRFSDWTQYANLQACFKEADAMYTAVRLANNWRYPSRVVG
ncbi:phospholipase A2 [Micromonospora lupini]|uniref:phospholipase A2 n=1 Tax=Micromonospora lupini TaxID=285679 RepID=UPI0031D97057